MTNEVLCAQSHRALLGFQALPTGTVSAELSAGLRHSSRTNTMTTVDGISTADEDMVEKAMKRAAVHSLDGPKEIKTVVHISRSPQSPSTPNNLIPGTMHKGTL